MSSISDVKIKELESRAKVIRRHIINMLSKAGSGHPGGSLSAVEILLSLYFHKMNHNPKEPAWPERDRFLMSKGHGAPVWYATLAEAGYFPVSELDSLRKLGSILQGHPDMKRTPGVECSSGSLGQGLSIASGFAMAGKMDLSAPLHFVSGTPDNRDLRQNGASQAGKKSYKVYALVGDGEVQEGQIWEAAMSSAHYKLDNLCAIQDYNGLQIDGAIKDVMSPLPLADKWRSFGWNVLEIDGHNFREIIEALDKADTVKGKPTVIIARTVKGKGVSFMENKSEWHGKTPSKEQTEKALQELQ
jgi:transketolase